MANEPTFKTTGNFETIVFVGADGKEETISLAPCAHCERVAKKEQSCCPFHFTPVVSPKPSQFRGVDAAHPFIVFIMGVPVFAASRKVPDRVEAMLKAGMPVESFHVLDTRNGAMYEVK